MRPPTSDCAQLVMLTRSASFPSHRASARLGRKVWGAWTRKRPSRCVCLQACRSQESVLMASALRFPSCLTRSSLQEGELRRPFTQLRVQS